MTVPEGFETHENSIGFTNKDGAAIAVMELSGENFYENATSRAYLKKKGMTVYEYEDIEIDEYKAKFAHVKRGANKNAYILAFGDSTFSLVITGIYQSKNKDLGTEIKKALLDVSYNKNLKTDVLTEACFILDDSQSILKFNKMTANIYFYSKYQTTDNKTINSKDNTFLLVIPVPKEDKRLPKAIAEAYINGIEKNGFSKRNPGPSSDKKVNGYNSYETTVYGTYNGEKAVIYSLVVSNSKATVCLAGVTSSPEDIEATIEEIKKLAHTVRLKD